LILKKTHSLQKNTNKYYTKKEATHFLVDTAKVHQIVIRKTKGKEDNLLYIDWKQNYQTGLYRWRGLGVILRKAKEIQLHSRM